MAPGDANDLPAMLDFALAHSGPCAIRYPKGAAVTVDREIGSGEDKPASKGAPIQYGQSEVVRQGTDGCLIACGALLVECVTAAESLRNQGLDVGVINARFIKPLDTDTIHQAIRDCPFVLTVEEAALAGGFGSAVLEGAVAAGLDTRGVCRLGIPDTYVEHGQRGELLADLGLDANGIVATSLKLAEKRRLYELRVES
jgi:1-deoxy-D-xylulose-5-phosphate synthase